MRSVYRHNKKIAALFLCLLSFILPHLSAQNISSQTFYVLDQTTNQLRPDREWRWAYDGQGRNTEQAGWLWNVERNSYEQSFEKEFTYHSSGERLAEISRFWEEKGIRLLQRFWTYDADGKALVYEEYRQDAGTELLYLQARWEASYTAAGCLSEKTYFDANGQQNRRERYQYQGNCRVDTFLQETYDGDWQSQVRTTYQYQDSLEIVRRENWRDGSFTFQNQLRRRLDDQGRRLSETTLFQDSSQYRVEFAYDERGNTLWFRESQRIAGDSLWLGILEQISQYNGANQRIQQVLRFDFDPLSRQFQQRNYRSISYDQDGRTRQEQIRLVDIREVDSVQRETIFDYTYQFYCDGLLQERSTQRTLDGEQASFQTVLFGYTEVAACESVEEGIIIAPNPVRDQLSFRSPGLAEAPSIVEVWDIRQRLLWAGTVEYRTDHYILPVERLLPGYYVLRVRFAERQVSAPFLKIP